MSEHPIEGLMSAAMNNIRSMVDVNTIIGEPIKSMNSIIIPISKVGFGFAAGGSEFLTEAIDGYYKKDKEEEIQYKLPFGGGSGAGVSISPVAFLVIQGENVKLLHVNSNSAIDKLLDYVPDLLEKANCMINKQEEKTEENEKQDDTSITKIRPKIKRSKEVEIDDNEESMMNEFEEPEE